jgi:hypothetical protein
MPRVMEELEVKNRKKMILLLTSRNNTMIRKRSKKELQKNKSQLWPVRCFILSFWMVM